MKPIRSASAILTLLLLCGGVTHAQDTRGQQQGGQNQGGSDDADVLDPDALTPTPAPVTERPPVRDQTQPTRNQTGTPATNDDDADILDPSRVAGGPPVERPLEDTRRATPQVLVPPTDEKARLDAAIRDQVGGPAEQYGQELNRVNETMRTNPTEGARVVEGSLSESGRDLDDAMRDFDSAWNSNGGATGEVNDVTDNMNGGGNGNGAMGGGSGGVGNGGGALSSETDGWGDPIPLEGNTGGDERMSWWQKLTLTVLDAVHHGVKQLGNNRANELKLRAELLALSTDARYRPYVDFESRRAIENSAFARGGAGYDTRLNDLMLGNNRPLTATPSGTSGTSTNTTTGVRPGGIDRSNPFAGGPLPTGTKVTRLPRVRDPISGVERVVIDMPLGVDPVRPIR